MRVHISDRQVLLSLSPAQITAYLRGKGAECLDELPGKATVWQYVEEELLVPLSTHFADYASRVADLLAALERAEKRSQILIEADLRLSGFDVIRVKNGSEDARNGTLSLVRSADFLAKSRDLLLAAACSSATRRISCPGRKPKSAERFMETLRLGQTAAGSFLLEILAPVSPDLKARAALPDLPEVMPYEKTVVPVLQSGLEALNTAAQNASLDGTLDHFLKAAPLGLSTDLCDAVAALSESQGTRSVEVEISYSRNRRQPLPPARVSVDAGYIPLIREASAAIKAAAPEPEQVVRGMVLSVESEEPVETGIIRIKDVMASRPRVLQVQLAGRDYRQAIAARRQKQMVEISGTVIRSKRGALLVPESPLSILAEESP